MPEHMVASPRDNATGEKHLTGRFIEDIYPTTLKAVEPAMSTTTATVTTSPSPARVRPASIPIRTSSSKAILRPENDPESLSKSPRKHRSLGSVPDTRRRLPEIDERQSMSSGPRGNRMSTSSVQANSTPSTYPLEPAPTLASGSSPDPLRAGIGADLINGHVSQWSNEKENILRGPFDYLEATPGKDIRSQLITAFNAWLRVPDPSLRVITRAVAMLHSASLLVDDVEDNSQLRRGIPVAHSIFGTAQTINSANYIYFCALQELLTLNNPAAIRIYTEELLNLHRGQGMDLFWRDTLTCPTEDDYLEMVGNKTGGLFRLAIKLMCAESLSYNTFPSSGSSGATERTDYVPLVNTIGLLFQILDDYRNLSDTTYTQNKGLCEDLTEGKFSFPIIHAIRTDPANLVLINILKQKTTDDDVKRYAVSYMESTGSFAYTRRVLRGLTKKALTLVDEVDRTTGMEGKGDGIKGILERLRVDKQRDRVSMADISEGRER